MEIVSVRTTVNDFTNAEYALVFKGLSGKVRQRPLVVYAHTTGISARGFDHPAFGQYDICHKIASWGFTVVAGDLGVPDVAAPNDGKNTWCNAVAVARIEQMRLAAIAAGLCADTDIILVGSSMGGGNVLKYGITYPANVLGLVTVMGLVNLDAYYADVARGNNGVTGPKIAGAHGVAWPAALPAGASPHTNNAPIVDKPYLGFYSTDDAAIYPAESIAFEATMGKNGALLSLGALGHTELAISTAAGRPELEDFFWNLLNP